ncbi:hypothetical protein ACIPSA_28135 [Streptomyces sp. NPDC086549]|uniref:hypothetical protein n=1 Tax=Streptomyces sp. NPDC086549 TaxID=3365752 RepID=UPI0037FEEC26
MAASPVQPSSSASNYDFARKQIRRPDDHVDMEQLLRRLTRLEARIHDALLPTRTEDVRRIVEKTGLPHESFSEDVAEALGMQRPPRS